MIVAIVAESVFFRPQMRKSTRDLGPIEYFFLATILATMATIPPAMIVPS
jgi:hypothetical protein